jgi:hypothetical protein
LNRTRKDCRREGEGRPCAVGSLSRTMWDGSHELYEIRVPSTDNALYNVLFTTEEMESDTLTVRNLGRWDGFDPHPLYGRVAYTYGHGIASAMRAAAEGAPDEYERFAREMDRFAAVAEPVVRYAPALLAAAQGAMEAMDWPRALHLLDKAQDLASRTGEMDTAAAVEELRTRAERQAPFFTASAGRHPSPIRVQNNRVLASRTAAVLRAGAAT